MTIFKQVVCLLGIVLSMQSMAQTATISGSAPHWSGNEIRISVFADLISKTPKSLGSSQIDSLGNFDLKIHPEKSNLAWISVNRFNAPIYIEPGKTYQIKLLETPESVLIDTWQKGVFDYDFTDLDSTDLNALISRFDSDFYAFYVANETLLGSKLLKSRIDSFAVEQSNPVQNTFFENYRKYAIAEMKLSAGNSKAELFELYIDGADVDQTDPSWYRFFDLFFMDYFQSYDVKFGGATIYNRLNNDLSGEALDSLLLKDDFLQAEALRQMVMLKSVAEVFGSNKYRERDLLRIVNYVQDHTAHQEISTGSAFVKNKIKSSIETWRLSEVSKSWTPKLAANPDSLYTLLVIANLQSKDTQRELLLLESLKAKYPDIFQIAILDVNQTEQSTNPAWSLYQTEGGFQLLENLQVYGLPHFIWVNRDGIFDKMGIEKPSHGFEKRLFKIQSDRKESQKIRVGSK